MSHVYRGVYRMVGPAEAVAAQQHVSDKRLNRRLAYQPYEEELFDYL